MNYKIYSYTKKRHLALVFRSLLSLKNWKVNLISSQFSLVICFCEGTRKKVYPYSGPNCNVKNNCVILSNEFVQDFLEYPNVKNAKKIWPLSKKSSPIVHCGSFTYLMDSLTNFLPAFVPKICKKSWEQSKIQRLFWPKNSKLHFAI